MSYVDAIEHYVKCVELAREFDNTLSALEEELFGPKDIPIRGTKDYGRDDEKGLTWYQIDINRAYERQCKKDRKLLKEAKYLCSKELTIDDFIIFSSKKLSKIDDYMEKYGQITLRQFLNAIDLEYDNLYLFRADDKVLDLCGWTINDFSFSYVNDATKKKSYINSLAGCYTNVINGYFVFSKPKIL